MPLDDIQLHDVTPETAPKVMEQIICAPNFLRGVSLEDIKKTEETKANIEKYLAMAEPLMIRLTHDDIDEFLKEMELPGFVTGIATHLRGLVNTTMLDMRSDKERILEQVPPIYAKEFGQLLDRTENLFLSLSSLLDRTASETFYEYVGVDKLEEMTTDLRKGNSQPIGDFDTFEEFDALMRA